MRTVFGIAFCIVSLAISVQCYSETVAQRSGIVTYTPTFDSAVRFSHIIALARVIRGSVGSDSNQYVVDIEQSIKGKLLNRSLHSELDLKIGGEYLLFISGEHNGLIRFAMGIQGDGLQDAKLKEKRVVIGIGTRGNLTFLMPGGAPKSLNVPYTDMSINTNGHVCLRSSYSLSSVVAYIQTDLRRAPYRGRGK